MQGLAGRARELRQREEALSQASAAAEQGLADRARLHVLDLQLESYQGVDWDALAEGDPEHAELLWARFQQTRAARDAFARAMAQADDRRRLEAERRRAEQFAEAGKILSREIEGWSPEVANKLVDYAAAFGVTLDELREVADPRLWRILHRAHAADEASRREAQAAEAAQVQAVRPAITVAGAAAGSGGVRDELGTGEWMRRRNAQAARA
jgi:hypothetical protein